jgi:hypothetical protein
MTRCLLLLSLSLLPATSARGDVFHLTSGGRIEGRWLNPEEKPRESYLVRMRGGGTIKLADDQVSRVETTSAAEKEYRARLLKMPPTVEGHWEMAEFCRENGLEESRDFHLAAILKLDPDHEKARYGLGYSKVDGRWVQYDEYMRSRGYIKHRGRWRLPHEVVIEERQRKLEESQKKWREQLRMWRGWLGKKRSLEAQRNIQDVKDWRAAPAVVELLDDAELRKEKLLWIEVLGKLPTHAAWSALVRYAVEDNDEAIREACISKLEVSGTRPAVSVLLRSLDVDNREQINRAAIALGRMGDKSAVPALIEHLVTEHKVVQQAPSGGGLGPIGATFGRNGGGGLSAGNSTKVIEVELFNPGVLGALVALTGKQLGQTPDAWRQWYEETNTPKSVDLRRRDD